MSPGCVDEAWYSLFQSVGSRDGTSENKGKRKKWGRTKARPKGSAQSSLVFSLVHFRSSPATESLKQARAKGLDKREMFGDQTPSNIVWWPNILLFGHLVWCCLIVFYRVWSCLIKFEGHETFHQKCKTFLLFASLMDDVLFVCFVCSYQTCLMRMRSMLAQRLVSIASSVFDQTCFNRLATHFNISMFGHQTTFDGFWSQTFIVCPGPNRQGKLLPNHDGDCDESGIKHNIYRGIEWFHWI